MKGICSDIMTIACLEISSAQAFELLATYFGKQKRRNEQSIWGFKIMKTSKKRARANENERGLEKQKKKFAELSCSKRKDLIQLQIIPIQTFIVPELGRVSLAFISINRQETSREEWESVEQIFKWEIYTKSFLSRWGGNRICVQSANDKRWTWKNVV